MQHALGSIKLNRILQYTVLQMIKDLVSYIFSLPKHDVVYNTRIINHKRHSCVLLRSSLRSDGTMIDEASWIPACLNDGKCAGFSTINATLGNKVAISIQHVIRSTLHEHDVSPLAKLATLACNRRRIFFYTEARIEYTIIIGNADYCSVLASAVYLVIER